VYAFYASGDVRWCAYPVNFRTVKPGLRENAKLVEHLLVEKSFTEKLTECTAVLELAEPVLRHGKHLRVDVPDLQTDIRKRRQNCLRERSSAAAKFDDSSMLRNNVGKPPDNGRKHPLVARNQCADDPVIVLRSHPKMRLD